MKTRRQAAREIWHLQCMMQAHPYAYSTIYRRIYRRGGAWRFIGSAEYTA